MNDFDTAKHFRLTDHGQVFPYFYHGYNCGFASYPRLTERTVEMSVADRWLSYHAAAGRKVMEVGAVTPYYFDDRVKQVVDPADKRGTIKKSLFDVDFAGADVLCISTIEHIGEARYGLKERQTPFTALQHIAKSAKNFLITFPCGWRHPGAAKLESMVVEGDSWLRNNGIRSFVLTRGQDEIWRPAHGEIRPYGMPPKPWANSVIFLERGDVL